ncbi:hypothetical protein GS881_24530 [Rhodococcus hoagii]|nr:hypothetical protein [Prescottella equi]
MIGMADDDKLRGSCGATGSAGMRLQRELDCLPAVARARAEEYVRRTDAAAADSQIEAVLIGAVCRNPVVSVMRRTIH